jgi:hypothetical protein
MAFRQTAAVADPDMKRGPARVSFFAQIACLAMGGTGLEPVTRSLSRGRASRPALSCF